VTTRSFQLKHVAGHQVGAWPVWWWAPLLWQVECQDCPWTARRWLRPFRRGDHPGAGL
jgi:hypothetical protein